MRLYNRHFAHRNKRTKGKPILKNLKVSDRLTIMEVCPILPRACAGLWKNNFTLDNSLCIRSIARCNEPHSMPICIECRYPVSQLYHVLHSSNNSKKKPSAAAPSQKSTPAIPSATPRSRDDGLARTATAGLGDVRLMQCPRCKRFADKYVEHDFVVLFIDLVLVKPQVGSLAERHMSAKAELMKGIFRSIGTFSSTALLGMMMS